ncbi:uncharacterized protein LOC129219973 [Uloborus diversus]|uniref:uncharacterized protein LOC129219973 n=1 Tax=Uloborus diversus TaxID=327109 RepID=UPI0024098D37|nr:uncharacterized protein LOC129219973 [Uloborus diversus]
MTMTYQAHDGHVARSEDLHRHILRSHLAYLNQEETPSKLEQRRNLESLISEFLCVVSHGAKFTFIEISNILSHNIENNPNFSAYKAASAFEALEKYATNLISHPWRKEYKTVKLYSGFYKHSVESQLIGGDSVLQLLGYQFTDEGVLFLDEPVDPDKVARVALDCLTAYVECQIMVQICERVKAYKCSWLEIHNVREDYICGVDEAIRILHQLKRNAIEQDKQERWLRNQENGCKIEENFKPNLSSSYQKTGILVDVSNTWSSDNSYPPYEEESLLLQPTTVSNSYLSKSAKGCVPIHSKLSSWSEEISSPLSDYQNQGLVSRSDETDSYASRSLDDHIQMNYNFFNKSHNHVPRYLNSDLTPENVKDSWDLLQPSYGRRHNAYVNSDHDSHITGYSSTVPNMKESYTSHFGHPYPPPPQMMPLGLPSFSYHLPHDISIPLCQCQMCCERQFSLMPNKYQLPKDVSNNFDSNTRTSRIEANHDVDPSDICSSFLKISVDDARSSIKSKPFPISSTTYSSYENPSDCLNDVARSSTSKPIYHTPQRGSYYDNVPSPCDTEASCSIDMSGQSLNPKCDFQSNGIITCSASTLSIKPRSQKETPTVDSISCTLPTKQHKKNHASSSLTLVRESSSRTDLDLKNTKSLPPSSVQRDSKGFKKWSCTSCTFYNAAEKSICDMCGRSKLPGPEITPLVSGGRECPQCTLVNKKDTEDCTACGASLKDSPTYI